VCLRLHPGGGGVKRPQWIVRLVTASRRYELPKVELAGPAVEDFVLNLLDTLAESIHAGDGRAQAWADYLIARGNQLSAEADGCDTQAHDDAVMNAWDRLMPELPVALRMGVAEALFVAGQIDETCGRVGSVATA
jgi:hypothetical protein